VGNKVNNYLKLGKQKERERESKLFGACHVQIRFNLSLYFNKKKEKKHKLNYFVIPFFINSFVAK